MSITILDYVKSIVGDKPAYDAGDFYRNGVDMFGGCEICHAQIACYNAYPSTSGYWRCADCIGGTGYPAVADFVVTVPGPSPDSDEQNDEDDEPGRW